MNWSLILRRCILGHLCVVGLLTTNATMAQEPHAANPVQTTTPKARLDALFDEEWQYELRQEPETATVLGDNRYNDRLRDYSAAAFLAETDRKREFLAQFEAFPRAGLSDQDTLSLTLEIARLKQDIASAQFKPWEMPANQMDGPHLSLLELVTLTPFRDAKDYENYLSRLQQVPRMFSQVTENMRQGMHDRLMPPRYLLERVAKQSQNVASQPGPASPFAEPLKTFPAGVPAAEQQRLRAAILDAIDHEVIPAYQQLARFVRDEYAPHGRSDPGVWALPDGAQRYAFLVRLMTTTDLSPDQIHQIGLQQIAETEKQMLDLARQLGFKELAGLNEHIKKDRSLYATSGQQLLDLYTHYARQMEPKLPQLFEQLPKSRLAVIPMGSFRAKDAVPADYTPGAADGSRSGRINVNESDPAIRLLLNVEAIAYHEGVPGHHLQISLAQEMPDLPAFRRFGDYTAFIEGWAFYAERLGKEIGFYQDPYSEYGRLENEMWRDIRLVVDTGVHEKHWSREQVVDYFHRYTAMDESNIQTEVDRYIAWPGQALAYKLGQLEILKLREEARAKLGDKFDLRGFHQEVLDSGPLPLDVLQSKVEAWVAGRAAQ